jgi:hypothetical protein
MVEEARTPLIEAVLALGRACATEARLPEPACVDDVLLPPLSHGWKEALPVLRGYMADPNHPWQPVVEAVGKV